MSYKGKWIVNPKRVSEDAEISVLDVIGVKGNVCVLRNNKTISIEELKSKYVRAESVVENPFARKDLNINGSSLGDSGIVKSTPKLPTLEELENDFENVEENKPQPPQPKVVQPQPPQPKKLSKEEQLIDTLKQLGASSTISVKTDISVPIDINVIKTLLLTSQDMDKELFLKALVVQNTDVILDGIVKYLNETL